MLNNTDKFLVNDGSVTETVTWSDIKIAADPLIVSIVITPDEPVVNNQVTATPVITGGKEPYTVTGYQWHTSDDDSGTNQTPIAGATSNTYTPVSADANKFLGCTVTAVDNNGTAAEGTTYASLATDIGLELAKPEVLTPKKGAGIGGDVTYTPETSGIIAGGVEDVPSGTYSSGVTMVEPSDIGVVNTPAVIFKDDGSADAYNAGEFLVTFNPPIPYDAARGVKIQSTNNLSSGFSSKACQVNDGDWYYFGEKGPDASWDNINDGFDFDYAKQFNRNVWKITPQVSGTLSTIRLRNSSNPDGNVDTSNGKALSEPTYNSSNRVGLYSVIVNDELLLEEGFTKLTFTNDKAYDSADGTEMTTIDQAFKAGDKVVGNGDITVFADTAAFSTTLYTGTKPNVNPVTTGVDNTGKALVWIKSRSDRTHNLVDTLRGGDKGLYSNDNTTEQSSDFVQNFKTNGVDIGLSSRVAATSEEFVLWNFRAAPGFFDVVTYEGDGGSDRTVNHSLGSAPGLIIVKCTDNPRNWTVYHKEMGSSRHGALNNENGFMSSLGMWGDSLSEPTSKSFQVGYNSDVNELGWNYVAYLFAETPGLVKNGAYTGTGSSQQISTGFKPGWVLIKNTFTNLTNWVVYDSTRGSNNELLVNSSQGEQNLPNVTLSDTGFQITGNTKDHNQPSDTYVYIAIAEDAVAGQLPPTGVLTEDADKDNKQMTLTEVTGEWKAGLTAVNETEATEYAPCGDDIVFTSSKPATTVGTVTTWGAADWELTNKDTNDTQTASVTLKGNVDAEDGPTSFTLDDDTNYSVRVKYSSADPAAGPSEWSDVNNFKTCDAGKVWVGVEAPGNDKWRSITYGDGKFVAVATSGNSRIMYAIDPTDENNWELVEAPEMNNWRSVTYGDGKFVAVSNTNRIMWATDPTDASNWKIVIAPGDATWSSVAYGDGKFVAVAYGGTNRIMWATDPTDASNWKAVTEPESNNWGSVAYGNNYFVAVSSDGNNRIMWADQSDLNTWAEVQAPADSTWYSVTYGDGKFVAVASSGTDQIMYATNPAGPWTGIAAPENSFWRSITYGDGKFVAVADGGTNRTMHATDPTQTNNWTAAQALTASDDNYWYSVTHGDGKFVAVSISGTERIMYSFTGTGKAATAFFYDENNAEAVSDVTLERRYGVDANDTNLRKQGIYPLTEQPTYEVDAYVPENGHYKPIRSYEGELNRANERHC